MIPVVNLPKYAMFGDGGMMCVKGPADATDKIQRYVKFEEAVEASSNSLQQLKAEIAECSGEALAYLHAGHHDLVESIVIPKLQQLSAI